MFIKSRVKSVRISDSFGNKSTYIVEKLPVCPYSDTALSRCKHYDSYYCFDCIPFDPLCDHYEPSSGGNLTVFLPDPLGGCFL